jgi:hypothetical protein
MKKTYQKLDRIKSTKKQPKERLTVTGKNKDAQINRGYVKIMGLHTQMLREHCGSTFT